MVSFFAGRYSTSRVRNAQYDEISQLTDVMTVYQREVNGREQTIYEKNQLIGTQKEALDSGKSAAKNPNTIASSSSQTCRNGKGG